MMTGDDVDDDDEADDDGARRRGQAGRAGVKARPTRQGSRAGQGDDD